MSGHNIIEDNSWFDQLVDQKHKDHIEIIFDVYENHDQNHKEITKYLSFVFEEEFYKDVKENKIKYTHDCCKSISYFIKSFSKEKNTDKQSNIISSIDDLFSEMSYEERFKFVLKVTNLACNKAVNK